jgi:cyclophilin family peptidyl-prolyl cis-trans isomerase
VSKRTRNRQLARLAAMRQAERQRRQRRRRLATISVALVIALAGGGFAWAAFVRGGEEPAPTGPTAETGVTGPTGPTGEPGTRTGFVRPEPGPEEVACGGRVPGEARRRKPQFNAPAEILNANRTYTATLTTSCGDIVIELLADQAPQTVNSFVFLARRGFFDGTRIHRIDGSIDVIQGGDPTGTGTGGPGYTIPDELTGEESYGPGVFAMANSGPDTGGSQFFLITGENGHNLDDGAAWTIFGQVIEGLEVAQRIRGLEIQDPAAGLAGQQPVQAVYIEAVTISASRA